MAGEWGVKLYIEKKKHEKKKDYNWDEKRQWNKRWRLRTAQNKMMIKTDWLIDWLKYDDKKWLTIRRDEREERKMKIKNTTQYNHDKKGLLQRDETRLDRGTREDSLYHRL